MAFAVDRGLGQPPHAIGEEPQRHHCEHRPTDARIEQFQRARAILGSPGPERQKRDQQVHEATGGEPGPCRSLHPAGTIHVSSPLPPDERHTPGNVPGSGFPVI